MPTIESKIIDAAARRAAVRNAEADGLGAIIYSAMRTDDPVELAKLGADYRVINPSGSLQADIVIAEFVKDTKPSDFTKAEKALDAAEKKLADKQSEKVKLIKKIDAEINTLAESRDQARAVSAMSQVSKKRYEALKTGVPDAGYQAYAAPEIMAWARLEKLI